MQRRRRVALALGLGLVLGLLTGLASPAGTGVLAVMHRATGDPAPTTDATPVSDAVQPRIAVEDAWVVRVPYDSRDRLALLAARLDIWEVVTTAPGAHAGAVIAQITGSEAGWLREQGFIYEEYARASRGLEARGLAESVLADYSCYRTVDELHAQLHTWAAAYPVLTELRSIGSSFEGRPLLALRLTNEATGLDKPVLLLIAAIHGRELITPEAAMQFIARLLEGYDRNPDITWILDHQIVEVLVSANPDGLIRHESGPPWREWRKNANPTHGWCGGVSYGIDLNRNSTWLWGGVGSSTDPCHLTYRGPAAGSELETQAIESFLRSLFTDDRPQDTTTPAPANKPGLFITLHSYSDLVLWPWGNSYDMAPNGPAMARLGNKLATFNEYTAQQSSWLYPTTGTTDDFAYGELGVAAYTFEIGGTVDGFYPLCSRYDALIEPNLDALLYAAKVSRAPYLLPGGPDALNLVANSGVMSATRVVTITARIEADAHGSETIAAAEVYLDTPPWLGGTPFALHPVDGAFDSYWEESVVTIPVDPLVEERRQLYVRGQSTDGVWGPVSSVFVTVTHGLRLSPPQQLQVTRPDTVVTHTLTLSSTGSLSRTVALTITGATWHTSVTPTLVHLGWGAATPVTVVVTVPMTPTTTVDRIALTATSTQPPVFTATAQIATSTLWATMMLPMVVKGQ